MKLLVFAVLLSSLLLFGCLGSGAKPVGGAKAAPAVSATPAAATPAPAATVDVGSQAELDALAQDTQALDNASGDLDSGVGITEDDLG